VALGNKHLHGCAHLLPLLHRCQCLLLVLLELVTGLVKVPVQLCHLLLHSIRQLLKLGLQLGSHRLLLLLLL
jgi:hypothetical protein